MKNESVKKFNWKKWLILSLIFTVISVSIRIWRFQENQQIIPRGVEATTLITVSLDVGNDITRTQIPHFLSGQRIIWVLTYDEQQRVIHDNGSTKFEWAWKAKTEYEVFVAIIDGNPQDKNYIRVSNIITFIPD